MGWSSMAEIGFDHGGIGAHFGRVADRQHFPFRHHDHPRTAFTLQVRDAAPASRFKKVLLQKRLKR